MKNTTKFLKFVLLPGYVAGLLIAAFLSGKIIDYPRGTPEGEVIGGIGFLVIMVSVVAIYYLIYQLNKKYKQRKSLKNK